MGIANLHAKGRGGHSLVELLVCVAIIGILAAMYLPALSKARRKAEEVAVKEGLRQDYIGHFSDSANSPNARGSSPTREQCREAYRQYMTTTERQVLATRLLYAVKDEAEFRAYWNTLINPDATAPLEFDRSGGIIVEDEAGNRYTLPTMDSYRMGMGAAVPEAWEFISTNLGETTSGTLGTSVLYSDGHVEYIRYPGAYPVCWAVAELSHRFVAGT